MLVLRNYLGLELKANGICGNLFCTLLYELDYDAMGC